MRRANFIVKKKAVPTKAILSVLLVCATIALIANERPNPTRAIASAPAVAAPQEKVVVSVKPVVVPHDELSDVESKFHAQQIVGLESMEREKNSKALRITLNSDVFFKLGTARLEEGSKDSILQIINILKPMSSVSTIEIEGHTDGSPVIHQKPNYPSNWELSAARAASLIPLFAGNGFFKDQLKVIGYGDSRPMFSNQASNKISAKNRRIVLRVFAQEDEIKI